MSISPTVALAEPFPGHVNHSIESCSYYWMYGGGYRLPSVCHPCFGFCLCAYSHPRVFLFRCEQFAERGCTVYATSRRLESMEGFKHDSNIRTMVMDVTKDDDVQTVVQKVLAGEGKIDIVVNNAGAFAIGKSFPHTSLPSTCSVSDSRGFVRRPRLRGDDGTSQERIRA